MKYELFISDFDGTLGVSPGIIDGGTLSAIKKYQEKGGIFCIVTGRSYLSIKEICVRHGVTGVVGAFQGAKIVDLKTDKPLFTGGLDHLLAVSVIKRLKKDNIVTAVWIDNCLYYEELSNYVSLYISDNGQCLRQVDDLAKAVLELKKPIDKVIAMEDKERIKEDIAKYSKEFGDKLIVNSGASFLMEFINPVYHKGYAVEFLAKHYGIPLDKVITVGDSLNDVLLMDERWHGVCVGDGDVELKKLAKEITVSFKENPIKYLLDKYCLN